MNSARHSCSNESSNESSVDVVRVVPDCLGILSPSHRNRLIQAHARRLYSKLWRAPIAAQRRLEQQWQNTVTALSELYLRWTGHNPSCSRHSIAVLITGGASKESKAKEWIGRAG